MALHENSLKVIILCSTAQKPVEQMPPHQIKFEREADRALFGDHTSLLDCFGAPTCVQSKGASPWGVGNYECPREDKCCIEITM